MMQQLRFVTRITSESTAIRDFSDYTSLDYVDSENGLLGEGISFYRSLPRAIYGGGSDRV